MQINKFVQKRYQHAIALHKMCAYLDTRSAYLILRTSAYPRVTFLQCVMHPRFLTNYLTDFDKKTDEIFLQMVELPLTSNVGRLVNRFRCLPVFMGGLGIPSSIQLAPSSLVASVLSVSKGLKHYDPENHAHLLETTRGEAKIPLVSAHHMQDASRPRPGSATQTAATRIACTIRAPPPQQSSLKPPPSHFGRVTPLVCTTSAKMFTA